METKVTLGQNKSEEIQVENVITLESLLSEYKIKHITSFEEIMKIIDLSILDKNNSPKIVTDSKTCIIFDNNLFNETYLLDIVNDFIKNHIESEDNWLDICKINFIYVDDFYTRIKLFNPSKFADFSNEAELSPEETTMFEKSLLVPNVMFINPEKNSIDVLEENLLMPIDSKQFSKFIENLY